MTNSKNEKFEGCISKGKWPFILRVSFGFWIIPWTIPCALVIAFLEVTFLSGSFVESFVVSLITITAFGMALGLFLWVILLKKYERD